MDYLNLDGDINGQARLLLNKAFEDPKWLEYSIIRFIQAQMQRVTRNEIVPSTIQNYIKSLRTFLQMNDFPDGASIRKVKISVRRPSLKDIATVIAPRKKTINTIRAPRNLLAPYSYFRTSGSAYLSLLEQLLSCKLSLPLVS